MSEPAKPMMTLAQLQDALKGLLTSSSVESGRTFGPVTTDSRNIVPGCVFIAIRGERFDGHDFALQAAEQGAGVLVLEHSVGAACPELIVSNTREAFGAIARAWRSQFSIPMVCVVGANGKTTTTQMIASILRTAVGEDHLVATEQNFNNGIGVPQTLLRLNETTQAAVVEAGSNHPGEMAQLISWIRPTVVVVTNAQREHQEFFGSIEGSARENGMAIVSLSAKGMAVLPVEDACFSIWRDLVRARGCRMWTYTTGNVAAHVRAVGTGVRTSIILSVGEIHPNLQLPGGHVAHDAAAAAAACFAVGVGLPEIEKGLSTFRPMTGRGERHALASGAVLIDESYNANVDSMRAAIDVLATMPVPRILVAGEMGESGEKSADFHVEVGAYAKERGIDKFYAVGQSMRKAVDAFGSGATLYPDVAALTEVVQGEAASPCSILVKGSHYVGLSRLVRALVETGKTEPEVSER